MRPTKSFDQEKVHFNLARLKTHGANFEIVIDPDVAVEFKKGSEVEISEVLKSEQVFSDAKKGELASEEQMNSIFGTTDALAVSKKILDDGEIQLTQEYREKLREEKKKRLINLIHINAIDPKQGTPHPESRIENAISEANVKIDEFKTAEDQVQDVVKKLQPILPIKFAVKNIQVHIPAEHAAKMYSTVKTYGQLKAEDWLNDGSWLVNVVIPAGLQNEFFDALNSQTQGNVEIKILD